MATLFVQKKVALIGNGLYSESTSKNTNILLYKNTSGCAPALTLRPGAYGILERKKTMVSIKGPFKSSDHASEGDGFFGHCENNFKRARTYGRTRATFSQYKAYIGKKTVNACFHRQIFISQKSQRRWSLAVTNTNTIVKTKCV